MGAAVPSNQDPECKSMHALRHLSYYSVEQLRCFIHELFLFISIDSYNSMERQNKSKLFSVKYDTARKKSIQRVDNSKAKMCRTLKLKILLNLYVSFFFVSFLVAVFLLTFIGTSATGDAGVRMRLFIELNGSSSGDRGVCPYLVMLSVLLWRAKVCVCEQTGGKYGGEHTRPPLHLYR